MDTMKYDTIIDSTIALVLLRQIWKKINEKRKFIPVTQNPFSRSKIFFDKSSYFIYLKGPKIFILWASLSQFSLNINIFNVAHLRMMIRCQAQWLEGISFQKLNQSV